MTLSKKELEELRKKNPDINIPDQDLKVDSFNKLLDKAIEPKTLKEIKKKLGLKDADIAEMFGFKNVLAYRNSSAKERIDKGIQELYVLFHKKHIK